MKHLITLTAFLASTPAFAHHETVAAGSGLHLGTAFVAMALTACVVALLHRRATASARE